MKMLQVYAPGTDVRYKVSKMKIGKERCCICSGRGFLMTDIGTQCGCSSCGGKGWRNKALVHHKVSVGTVHKLVSVLVDKKPVVVYQITDRFELDRNNHRVRRDNVKPEEIMGIWHRKFQQPDQKGEENGNKKDV